MPVYGPVTPAIIGDKTDEVKAGSPNELCRALLALIYPYIIPPQVLGEKVRIKPHGQRYINRKDQQDIILLVAVILRNDQIEKQSKKYNNGATKSQQSNVKNLIENLLTDQTKCVLEQYSFTKEQISSFIDDLGTSFSNNLERIAQSQTPLNFYSFSKKSKLFTYPDVKYLINNPLYFCYWPAEAISAPKSICAIL